MFIKISNGHKKFVLALAFVTLLLLVGCSDDSGITENNNPLTLISSTPTNNDNNVPINIGEIILEFNKEFFNPQIRVENGSGIEIDEVTSSILDKKVRVSNFKLEETTGYQVSYRVEDNEGEPLSGSIKFTTEIHSTLPNILEDEINQTMMQAFYWEMNVNNSTMNYADLFPEEANLWNLLVDRADDLVAKGITALWLPPANKAMSETADVGYGTYDLWDLGEFYRTTDSSVKRTKYGTKDELVTAVDTLHSNGIKVYYDAVFNHRMGGDSTEVVSLNSGEEVEAWTDYNMKGRQEYYSQASDWSWDWHAFDATGWDQSTGTEGRYIFEGKNFDEAYGDDYLMGEDVDYDNSNVVAELKEWGAWITGERSNSQVEFDGFRLDAVKHVKDQFISEWISNVQDANSSEDIFFVGEAWEEDINSLVNYLDTVDNSNLRVFDFPLRSNFVQMINGDMDMSQLGNVGLVNESGYEDRAVTFIDNHDTDRDEGSYTTSIFKRKYQAYAYILMRENGIPTIYWKDYYIWGMKDGIDKLLEARKYFAYGPGVEVENNDQDVYSYVRKGLDDVPGTGLVMMISDDDSGDTITKRINSYQPNTKFYDYTGNVSWIVKTDDQGYGEFKLREDEASGSNTAHGWSIWVPVN